MAARRESQLGNKPDSSDIVRSALPWGKTLQARRLAAELTTKELAKRAGCDPAFVVWLEMLPVRPASGLADRVEALLDLHLDPPSETPPEPGPEGLISRRAFTGSLSAMIYYAASRGDIAGAAMRPRLGREMIDDLDAARLALVARERAFGPAELIASAAGYLSLIRRLLREGAPGSMSRDLLRSGAQWADFAGWLHQSAGAPAVAASYEDLAVTWARVGGNARLEAYFLGRRSQIAVDADDRPFALSLARTTIEDGLPPTMKAFLLQQRAHAYSGMGVRKIGLRLLDEADELVDGPHAHDHSGERNLIRADYVTHAYLALQRGKVLTDTGRPRAAIEVLEAGMRKWPRDFYHEGSLVSARLAVAHAAVGDMEESARAALRTVRIAKETGAGRAMGELAPIIPALRDHRRKSRSIDEFFRNLNNVPPTI
ncbi:hypothetical protein [Microbispora triticiradicis]|uniref:hypothetical protein n=1 Tax=Microbispora triticiradicis TaxID=2200763 RepID=UPI001AD6B6CE|nr:hypothetical protein [Microbispora triticiradicis]MBO4272281.1 hypothetical protein [Microbispora triticiradicis]